MYRMVNKTHQSVGELIYKMKKICKVFEFLNNRKHKLY